MNDKDELLKSALKAIEEIKRLVADRSDPDLSGEVNMVLRRHNVLPNRR